MRFDRVHLKAFRNYQEALLEPAPGLNLFVGPNASGKTNLLEALAVLCSGRSPRLKGAELLVRRGESAATLAAKVEDAGGEPRRVRVGLDLRGSRKIRLDERPARRLSQLVGLFPVVQLFPEDLAMPGGSPRLRRAFMDQLATALIPGFVDVRKQEERALRQRNAALKARRPSREVRALDGPFLERASEVLEARGRAVGQLRECLVEVPQAVAPEELQVDYWALGRDRSQLRRTLEERLVATQADERRLGATQVGPHRDDLRVRLGGLPVSGNASRGQLRSLMLRLKLAEALAVARRHRRRPALLLDDALSDMDAGRRSRTLEELGAAGQVFLTVPEPPRGAGQRARLFGVREGTVRPLEG